jgi:NADH dehydrogenase [ubiquinone] 1 alpha subcomplex assembly factor 7
VLDDGSAGDAASNMAAQPGALTASLAAQGQMSLADYMASANTAYYGSRDPLGADGDFITAPEISQIFGELIGLWLCDIWLRAGKPKVHYVELGPGRGTLARDALRVAAKLGLQPEIHLVETSPVMRLRQAENLPCPQWHDSVDTLPSDAPLFIIANEFFDALPIHQMVKGETAWHQRDVSVSPNMIAPVLGRVIPETVIPEGLRSAALGSIIETSPMSVRITGVLAERLAAQGGVGLIIDYGYDGPAIGDTLQAVKAHQFANPFQNPGDQDLTAHVDFGTLSAMARAKAVAVSGPVGQGQFLMRLGIAARTVALSNAKPEEADMRASERDRLTGEDAMGRLFQAMAMHHADWPQPDGFHAHAA